ncbi:MAG: hypothetical protein GXO32_08930 [Crenarchaeota archaeon]|nr:hypothetical protein [Thermoproteota archaeon]
MRGQGSVISVAILVLAAIILGTAFVVYFTTTTSAYRSTAVIEQTVAKESLDTVLEPIATWRNATTGYTYAFIMVRRLDNTPATILIIPYIATGYSLNTTATSGIVIKRLNPAGDTDGIFCDEATDCIPLVAIPEPATKILINPAGRGWMPFSALYNVQAINAFVLHYSGGSQILLLQVPSTTVSTIYVALATQIGNSVYVYKVVSINVG